MKNISLNKMINYEKSINKTLLDKIVFLIHYLDF